MELALHLPKHYFQGYSRGWSAGTFQKILEIFPQTFFKEKGKNLVLIY